MDSEKRSFISEDWLSLWIGLFVFILSLGIFLGLDVLGWGIKTNIWTDLSNTLQALSKNYEDLPGVVSLILTYGFLLITIGIGIKAIGEKFKDFIVPFTIIFFISYFCWLVGHYAYIAATSDKLTELKISWSLNLT